MSNFTHISPASVTGLLSTKTPALITIYNTVIGHLHIGFEFEAPAFTNKSTKLQIVTALNTALSNACLTYEMVEAELQSGTAVAKSSPDMPHPATPGGSPVPTPGETPEPIVPNVSYTPTDTERAIAASAIRRLRKNGVAGTTIRSTLATALSSPCTTEDDGTTSHGVATAGLTILDTPATSRARATTQSNPRTTLLPTTIITSVVATNPKKPSGKSAARFNEYYTLTAPFTVADVLATTSLTRADILWDHAKGFITFA